MDERCEQLVTILESTLQQMTQVHADLLTILERKRDAMRRGDARQMADLCSLENQKIQVISELEKKRLELVAQITLMVQPGAARPMALAELAQHLPEPLRDRVVLVRQQLREQMTKVREQTSIARRAADSLMRHMQGLMQTIAAASSGGPTYSRRGTIPQQPSGMTTFSTTA